MKVVKDLTIVIGPPGLDSDKEKFEGYARNAGKDPSEIWLEYVTDVVSSLSDKENDGSTTKLDEMFDKVFGIPAHTSPPFIGYSFENGVKYPAIVFDPRTVVMLDRQPYPIDWSDKHVRDSIGSVFAYLFKTSWTRNMVVYE